MGGWRGGAEGAEAFLDITPSPPPRFRWGFVFDRINRIFGEIYQLWQEALDPVGVEKGNEKWYRYAELKNSGKRDEEEREGVARRRRGRWGFFGHHAKPAKVSKGICF